MENIITQRGSLFKVKCPQKFVKEAPIGGKRGLVTGFSAASRKRLLELFAQLIKQQYIFITLTYGQEFPEPGIAKAHLRAFIERLRRINPKVCGVWRIEFQQRGAPHFHLLMTFLPYIPKSKVTLMWEEIIGEQYRNNKQTEQGNRQKTFTRIESCKNSRKVMAYVAKYVAKKSERDSANGGFNDVAYLHVGRHWGYINKDKLPFAPESIIEVHTTHKAFHDFRRAVERAFKRRVVKRRANCGFTLFTENGKAYLRYLFSLMESYPLAALSDDHWSL